MTVHYDGRNRAWGGFARHRPQPGGGSLSIVVGDKPRTWLAQYGPGGTDPGGPTSPTWKPDATAGDSDDQRLARSTRCRAR
jgi:hypothetical protein